jgi:hypothetical protein
MSRRHADSNIPDEEEEEGAGWEEVSNMLDASGHDESWIVQDASRQARTPDINVPEDVSTAEYQGAEDDDRAMQNSSYFDPPPDASFRASVGSSATAVGSSAAGKKPMLVRDSMEEPSLLGGSIVLAGGQNEVLNRSGTDAGTQRAQALDEVSIRIHRESRTVRESAGSVYLAGSAGQSGVYEEEVPAAGGKEGVQKASALQHVSSHTRPARKDSLSRQPQA